MAAKKTAAKKPTTKRTPKVKLPEQSVIRAAGSNVIVVTNPDKRLTADDVETLRAAPWGADLTVAQSESETEIHLVFRDVESAKAAFGVAFTEPNDLPQLLISDLVSTRAIWSDEEESQALAEAIVKNGA